MPDKLSHGGVTCASLAWWRRPVKQCVCAVAVEGDPSGTLPLLEDQAFARPNRKLHSHLHFLCCSIHTQLQCGRSCRSSYFFLFTL